MSGTMQTRQSAKANARKLGEALPCAIYTRKSSEEGLEQGFNSLDARARPVRPSS